MVMCLTTDQTGGARDALQELARRYWYPVYVYLRRCGHAPELAGTLARRFLYQLGSESANDAGFASHTHYRSYLLARMRAFLAAKQQAPVVVPGGEIEVPADLEERYQRDHVDAPSPEESYHRAFALQILHRSLRRLREEARQTGHLPMYEKLEAFLVREPVSGEYDTIATALRIRPLATVVALKRLRQRFRELAGEELADTVSSAAELELEQEALLDVLAGVGK